ncbi:thymocyte nuclear protein 1-like [Panthera leo]|uniref:thymocyte nuclear protein 1-like n=1 Tax=Panthera leo TaxID=9689 RepID=UPI001C6A6BA2|nr:thymocyte nuclear protein 1-like [Panthera leo]
MIVVGVDTCGLRSLSGRLSLRLMLELEVCWDLFIPPRGAKKLAELRVSMVAKASAISAYSCAKERVKEEKARQSCPVSQQSESESQSDKGLDVKFSTEDLKAQSKQTGMLGWCLKLPRQAWNFLPAMKLEGEDFSYHSNCKKPGITELVKLMKEAYPDHTHFEKNNPHYDPYSKEDNPKLSLVDVQFVPMMKHFITLAELKTHHQALKKYGSLREAMALFTRQRLSIHPLTLEEFDFILNLEKKEPS